MSRQSSFRNVPGQLQPFLESLVEEGNLISLKGDSIARKSQSFWITISSDHGAVEGKLHIPTKDTPRLIIFEPGFPGDGSTRFEKSHVGRLLDEGYSIFAVRHNGTIINGPFSTQYLDCSERQLYAKWANQEVLGTKATVSIADWLTEPLVSIASLGAFFAEIFLVGHSFGSLATLWSLAELIVNPSVGQVDKVRRFVSLTGATGRLREANDPILVQWRTNLDTNWARQRVAIGDVEENVSTLQVAYERIHDPRTQIPESIEMIYVTPWGDSMESLDEMVSPLEALDIIASLGHGSLVIDKTQSADKTTGRMVHDMDNLDTSTVIALLRDGLLGTGKIATIK